MEFLHARNGLGELFNSIFMNRCVKSVVQVRSVRQDKSEEDFTKIRGIEVRLRTIQFGGVQNIQEKLNNLSNQGILGMR